MTAFIIVHTLNRPAISYDPAKNAKNLARGRPSFDEVAEFDFSTACIVPDARRDNGEARYIAYGLLGVRVMCCYSPKSRAASGEKGARGNIRLSRLRPLL